MAWWGTFDSANLSKMVSSSLKNAQLKIDKVLDIQETLAENQQILAKTTGSEPLHPSISSSESFSLADNNNDDDNNIESILQTPLPPPPIHSILQNDSNRKLKSKGQRIRAQKLSKSNKSAIKVQESENDLILNSNNENKLGDWVTGESMTASLINRLITNTSNESCSELAVPLIINNSIENDACDEMSSPSHADLPSSSSDLLHRSTHSNISLSLSDDASSATLQPLSFTSLAPHIMTRSSENTSSLSTSANSSMLDSSILLTGPNETVLLSTESQVAADSNILIETKPPISPPILIEKPVSLDLDCDTVDHDHDNVAVVAAADNNDDGDDDNDQNNMTLSIDSSSYVKCDKPVISEVEQQTIPLEVNVPSLEEESSCPPIIDSNHPHPMTTWSLSPSSEHSSTGIEALTQEPPERLPQSCNSLPDTGTSSDIEVISSCCASSTNGEAVSNTLPSMSDPPFSHKRTASGSNLQSPAQILRGLRDVDLVNHNNSTSEALLKKLIECRQMLEIRESKLLEQNRENLELREELNQLKQSIDNSGTTTSSTNLDRLTQEFTDRLRNAENRFQSASKERDQLKKELQKLSMEIASKDDEPKVTRALTEKEQQIAELMKEGEKLAQEQMKKSVLIKNLRNKEKELDLQLVNQTEKVNKLNGEVDSLKKQLNVKEENEKKHVEAIHQLTNSVQRQDRDMHRLKEELENTTDKCRGYQTALETSSKEILNFHRQIQSLQSELETTRFQLANDENGRENFERKEQEWQYERERIQNDLTDLRTALSRKDREISRIEETLRTEIRYYQDRLSAAEERNEELSQSLTSATKPILRQLEALQAHFASQNVDWEKLESTLNTRIAESQQKLAQSSLNERAWREKVVESEAQLSGLQMHIVTLKEENLQLHKDLQQERSKSHSLDLKIMEMQRNQDESKRVFERQLADYQKTIVLLEGSLDSEKVKVEAEKTKYAQLKAENALLLATEGRLMQHEEVSFTPRVEYAQSEASHASTTVFNDMPSSNIDSSTPLYDTVRAQGSAALTEHLHSLVKLKNGEIAQLHREIQQLQRSRDQLVEEVSQLHTLVDKQSSDLSQLQEKIEQMKDVDVRYQTLLLLYGEKLEENEELRLDLQDVKEMYRVQIEMLLKDK